MKKSKDSVRRGPPSGVGMFVAGISARPQVRFLEANCFPEMVYRVYGNKVYSIIKVIRLQYLFLSAQVAIKISDQESIVSSPHSGRMRKPR